MKKRLCTSCGHVGEPVSQGVGSFTVDAIIWLGCLGLSIFSSFFQIMLIAVAWSVYHLALYKTTTCPSCGDIAMVKLDSKKAQEYQEEAKHIVNTVYTRR